MSREVVGTAEPDAEPAGTLLVEPGRDRPSAAGTPSAPAARVPRLLRVLLAAPPAPVADRPAPPAPRHLRRRVAALLTLSLLAGALAGWSGAGSWRDAQRRDVALASAGASAVVVGLDTSVGGTDASVAEGRRTAALRVDVLNLGAVPLTVAGRSDSFSAVRIRFVEPSGAEVAPQRRITVDVVVEAACDSPQALRVPPLQVTSPDGFVRDVVLDGTAPALADLCAAGMNGTAELVRGAAVPAGNEVADLVDGDRFRIAVESPSGRTTRVVGVRASGLVLDADPLPATVDGTRRFLWLERPETCDASVLRAGPPRYVDLDVDAGSGQTASVRISLGDDFAAWLLAGPCGAAAP